MNKQGDLQVWWIPQIPGDPFEFPVPTVAAGVMLMDALAKYDLFQFENNIKPDYCNAGGLHMWAADIDQWVDWYDEETEEDDPAAWLASQVPAL